MKDSRIYSAASPGALSKQTEKEARLYQATTEETEKSITLYTDGACSNNGQEGAVAGYGVWFGTSDER